MANKTAAAGTAIEALLKEHRKFPPPKEFAKKANVNRASIYKEALKNPPKFWERFAKELRWFKPWKTVLQWKAPYAKWLSAASSTCPTIVWTGTSTRPAGPRPRSSGKENPVTAAR